MIGYNNLGSKRVGVETHQDEKPTLPSVERVILVNAWLEQAIDLVVARVATRLGIELT